MLLYFLKPKLIGLLIRSLIGLYLFLLQAIIAKPELIEASCFVLLFILNFEDIYYVGEVKSISLPELKKQFPYLTPEELEEIQKYPGNTRY